MYSIVNDFSQLGSKLHSAVSVLPKQISGSPYKE